MTLQQALGPKHPLEMKALAIGSIRCGEQNGVPALPDMLLVERRHK